MVLISETLGKQVQTTSPMLLYSDFTV